MTLNVGYTQHGFRMKKNIQQISRKPENAKYQDRLDISFPKTAKTDISVTVPSSSMMCNIMKECVLLV